VQPTTCNKPSLEINEILFKAMLLMHITFGVTIITAKAGIPFHNHTDAVGEIPPAKGARE
jgi:hypothetical protein